VNVLFVYRIIISEFCGIGKWGNDGWIGRRIFGIKFGIVEFFGGFGGGFVGEEEDLVVELVLGWEELIWVCIELVGFGYCWFCLVRFVVLSWLRIW
jgi:hypothetical protein